MNKTKLLTSLSISALAMVAGVQTTFAAQPGDLVKTESSSAVYYVSQEGKRHAFPNASIYFSWYDDFSSVQVISDFELSLLPLGKNILYKANSTLMKTPDVGEVYVVGPYGNLANIETEEVAISMYGRQWGTLVSDLNSSFFFDYTISDIVRMEDDVLVYPHGSLIQHDGLTYLVDKTTKGAYVLRPVSGAAWFENRFDKAIVSTYPDNTLPSEYEFGIPVYTSEFAYTCVYCPKSSSVQLFIDELIPVKSEFEEVLFEIPSSWNKEWFEIKNASTFFTARKFVASEQEVRFSLYREQLEVAESLQSYVGTKGKGLDDPNFATLYQGQSLQDANYYDIVQRSKDGNAISWQRYIQLGDDVYRAEFFFAGTSKGLNYSQFIELMDEVFASLIVQEGNAPLPVQEQPEENPQEEEVVEEEPVEESQPIQEFNPLFIR